MRLQIRLFRTLCLHSLLLYLRCLFAEHRQLLHTVTRGRSEHLYGSTKDFNWNHVQLPQCPVDVSIAKFFNYRRGGCSWRDAPNCSDKYMKTQRNDTLLDVTRKTRLSLPHLFSSFVLWWIHWRWGWRISHLLLLRHCSDSAACHQWCPSSRAKSRPQRRKTCHEKQETFYEERNCEKMTTHHGDLFRKTRDSQLGTIGDRSLLVQEIKNVLFI